MKYAMGIVVAAAMCVGCGDDPATGPIQVTPSEVTKQVGESFTVTVTGDFADTIASIQWDRPLTDSAVVTSADSQFMADGLVNLVEFEMTYSLQFECVGTGSTVIEFEWISSGGGKERDKVDVTCTAPTAGPVSFTAENSSFDDTTDELVVEFTITADEDAAVKYLVACVELGGEKQVVFMRPSDETHPFDANAEWQIVAVDPDYEADIILTTSDQTNGITLTPGTHTSTMRFPITRDAATTATITPKLIKVGESGGGMEIRGGHGGPTDVAIPAPTQLVDFRADATSPTTFTPDANRQTMASFLISGTPGLECTGLAGLDLGQDRQNGLRSCRVREDNGGTLTTIGTGTIGVMFDNPLVLSATDAEIFVECRSNATVGAGLQAADFTLLCPGAENLIPVVHGALGGTPLGPPSIGVSTLSYTGAEPSDQISPPGLLLVTDTDTSMLSDMVLLNLLVDGRTYLRNFFDPFCTEDAGTFTCPLGITVTPIYMRGHLLPPGNREACLHTGGFSGPPTGRFGDCVTFTVE
jgi:hypothetical protein